MKELNENNNSSKPFLWSPLAIDNINNFTDDNIFASAGRGHFSYG